VTSLEKYLSFKREDDLRIYDRFCKTVSGAVNCTKPQKDRTGAVVHVEAGEIVAARKAIAYLDSFHPGAVAGAELKTVLQNSGHRPTAIESAFARKVKK
jgi:hypothetical protein